MPISISDSLPAGLASTGDRLLVAGLGYTAGRFLSLHGARFTSVTATVRTREKARVLAGEGVEARVLKRGRPLSLALAEAARSATHLLVSVPPDARGDAALESLTPALEHSAALRWIGYLSTVGVYGDHSGEWVDENTPPAPASARARHRLDAEHGWRTLGEKLGAQVQVFRLPGIYGPGRNALLDIKNGKAKRISKAGQVFNRAHVDDITAAIAAGIENPEVGPLINVADDEPAPQHEVVRFAAELLGMEPPPLVALEEANLSEMARSFWSEAKRVRNARLHSELGVSLTYPTYREGLRALHESGEGR